MSIHPNGNGTGWTNVETVDVDQPHGKDYLYSQHIAIGVRKRLDQEHSTFADATVGGIHTPGGCAILGMEISDDGGDITTPVIGDGTYRARGLVWSWDGSQNARLWCATKAAGISITGDWTVLMMHPDKQWGGRDVTWTGAHEFDASVDISGNVALDGDFSVDGTAAFTDASFDGTVDFAGAVAIIGDLSLDAGLLVDGTAVFNSEVDISGNLDVSGNIRVSGDASSTQFAAAWCRWDATKDGGAGGLTNVKGHFNISDISYTAVGKYTVYFANNLVDSSYMAIATIKDIHTATQKNIIACISFAVGSIGITTYSPVANAFADVSGVNLIVFGG